MSLTIFKVSDVEMSPEVAGLLKSILTGRRERKGFKQITLGSVVVVEVETSWS